MKHLTILVPDGQCNLSTVACVVGAYEIFSGANEYWKTEGKKEIFKIEVAGASEEAEIGNGLVTLHPQVNISTIKKSDLLIIPASLIRSYEKAGKGNRLLIDWVARQYKLGAEIAAMCTGAFTLASTGLLEGKNCSTHWSSANLFRSLFPNVHLQADKLITDENGICTNGGGYSFLNLVLYLIEKHYDRQAAIYCSKHFQVEIDRVSQSAFRIFTGQKQHGDEMVIKAQEYIEKNLHEKMSIDELASRFAIGRRNFDRRFLKATGNSPLEYSQRVRIESAKKEFEISRKTINEVMYDVGYSDVKAFRDVFKKITGMSPIDYKHKYNKEMAG
jgi:transcriptional regulator GlxA family with amidase domain